MRTRRFFILIAVFFLLTFSCYGCVSLGPKRVVRDRFDYTSSLADSWKDQMLINIVKLRYADAPVFLDISSVITSYEVAATANVGGSFSSNPNMAGATAGLGAAYANRPTVTYSPLSGEKFARSLMTPIPPSAVLNLIQSGYPVDLVLRLCVQTINGIENRSGVGMGRAADPRFYPLLEKMKKVQESGAIGLRVKKEGKDEAVLFAFRKNADTETLAQSRELRRILGLNPEGREFKVIYGILSENDQQIAMLTRSMLQVLVNMASYMEVPENDVKEGRVIPTFHEEIGGVSIEPLIHVKTSSEKPEAAFVAVPYRGKWFYIDDQDFQSKKMFSFLMFTFTLVETEDKAPAPVVTIPAR